MRRLLLSQLAANGAFYVRWRLSEAVVVVPFPNSRYILGKLGSAFTSSICLVCRSLCPAISRIHS